MQHFLLTNNCENHFGVIPYHFKQSTCDAFSSNYALCLKVAYFTQAYPTSTHPSQLPEAVWPRLLLHPIHYNTTLQRKALSKLPYSYTTTMHLQGSFFQPQCLDIICNNTIPLRKY